MRSIMSIVLTAVMLLSVLTGCGRSREDNNPGPAATAAPDLAATPDRADTAPGGDMEDAGDRVMEGAEDAVNGVGNAVGGVVNGAENAVDDILGDDGAVNGDFNDGDVADPEAKDETVMPTPEAR